MENHYPKKAVECYAGVRHLAECGLLRVENEQGTFEVSSQRISWDGDKVVTIRLPKVETPKAEIPEVTPHESAPGWNAGRDANMDDSRIERLVDGARRSEQYSTFEVPTKEELVGVRPGTQVKIGLEWDAVDGVEGERFWVMVLARKEDHFCGLIINELEFVESVEMLDLVGFDARHVLSIMRGEARTPMKVLEECAEYKMGVMV